MNDYEKLKLAGFSDYATMEKENGVNPVEVSEQYFFTMLEILMPAKWTRNHFFESFYVDECVTGNLFQWLVRMEGRYYALIAPHNKTHKQIINKVKECFIDA
jgi:hypothetical protein